MDGLAELQVAALTASSPLAAIELAREAGYDVLGCGSSRLGIGEADTVVKIAHTVEGLLMNLHEMAVWQAFPPTARNHLTPCLELSPELILTQQRVDVIGPPTLDRELDDGWVDATAKAYNSHADDIYACREALGLSSERGHIRLNNHGLLDGRVVTVDYGDQFPPLPQVWAHLLNIESAEHITFRDLAERAGLVPDADLTLADYYADLGLVAPERTAA